MDNSCLLQLLNNRRLTTIDISAILNYSYNTAHNRIKISDFSIREANTLAKYLKIPLTDFAEILDGNKDILKNYIIKNTP